ncbi:hypothetical protein JCM8208_000650 [Rhodotorula glutinis]
MAQLFLDAADQLDKPVDASDASIPASPSPSPFPSSRSSSPFAPPPRRRSASAPPALSTEVRRPEPAWSPAETAALRRARVALGHKGWAVVKRAMAAEGWKGRALSSLKAQWEKPVLVGGPAPLRRRVGQLWTAGEDQCLVTWLEGAAAPADSSKHPTLAAWTSKDPRLHRRSLVELVGRIEHLVQAGHANKLDTSKVVKLLFDLRGMYAKAPPVVAVRVSAPSNLSLMDRVVSKKKGDAVVVKVDGRLAHGPLPAARRLTPRPKAPPAIVQAPPPLPPSPPLPPPPPPSPAPVKPPRVGRPPAEAYFPSRHLPPPARTTRWFTRPPIVDLPRYTHWAPSTLNVARPPSFAAHLRSGPLLLRPPPPAPPSLPALSCSSSTTAPSASPPPVDLVAPVPVRPSASCPRSMAHLLAPGPAAAPPPATPPQQPQRQPTSTAKSTGKRLWDVLDSGDSMTVFERRTRMRVGGRGGTWIDAGRQGRV